MIWPKIADVSNIIWNVANKIQGNNSASNEYLETNYELSLLTNFSYGTRKYMHEWKRRNVDILHNSLSISVFLYLFYFEFCLLLQSPLLCVFSLYLYFCIYCILYCLLPNALSFIWWSLQRGGKEFLCKNLESFRNVLQHFWKINTQPMC